MLYFGSYLGFQFLATLYVQYVAHWSPVDTALAFLPSGAFLPILGSQSERLIGRFGTRRLIAAGLTAFAIGYALFLREHSPHLAYTTMLLPSMVVIGLGFPALNVQATAAVTDAEQGLATGLFNTAFQFGGAVFVAIVSAVISSHTAASGGGEASGVLDAMRPAIAILIPVAMAGTVVLFTARQPRPKLQSTEALLPDIEAN
jgi:fucose permease